METKPRWIEYVPVSELVTKRDPRNPKAHDLDELRASMTRWGYTESVTLDERTGLLVSGHGRVEVCFAEQERGGDVPEGVVLDDDGGWLLPVTRGWSSKDAAEAGAYLVAANRLTERGGWLGQELLDLLEAAKDTEDGLSGLGYDEQDLGRLAAELRPLEPEAPEGFPTFDDTLPTEHRCPKCGYEWS